MVQLLLLRIYAESFLITMDDFSGISKTSAYYITHRVSAAIIRLQCNSNLEITNVVAHWHGSVHDSTIFNIF